MHKKTSQMYKNQLAECVENYVSSDNLKSVKYRQYFAAFTVTILAISNGISAAWTSPIQNILQSENNPVGNEPLSDSAFSWVASTLYIGALLGIFIWNKIADKFGRKINGYLLCFTQILGWIGITLASNATHLIVSRFIMGFGACGILSNCQLYINETADSDIKRPLCSLILIGMNFGIVLVYLMGWFLPYRILNLACLCTPVTFVVLFFWLPETPLYLLMKNRHQEARSSMNWYGLIEVDGAEAVGLSEDTKEGASLIELFANAEMAKTTSITLFLLIGQQMSGIGPMVAYSVSIFKLTGSSVSPYFSAVLVGFLQFSISCVSGGIVKSIPRKPLLLYSYVGAFLSYMLVFLYFYLKDYNDLYIFKLVPTVGVLCFIIAYNMGIGAIPFVIFSEIFPPRLLNHGVSVSLMMIVGGTFFFTKIFPTLKSLFGECGIFLFLACCNLFFALFVLNFVGERKQRFYDSIENSSSAKRALLQF